MILEVLLVAAIAWFAYRAGRNRGYAQGFAASQREFTDWLVERIDFDRELRESLWDEVQRDKAHQGLQ